MDSGDPLPIDYAPHTEDETTLATTWQEFPDPFSPGLLNSVPLKDVFGPPYITEFPHIFLNEAERAADSCPTAFESLGIQELGSGNPDFLDSNVVPGDDENEKQEPRRRATRQVRMERNRASAARSRKKRQANAQARQRRVDELQLLNRELTDYVALLASRLVALGGDISSVTNKAQQHSQHWYAEGMLAPL